MLEEHLNNRTRTNVLSPRVGLRKLRKLERKVQRPLIRSAARRLLARAAHTAATNRGEKSSRILRRCRRHIAAACCEEHAQRAELPTLCCEVQRCAAIRDAHGVYVSTACDDALNQFGVSRARGNVERSTEKIIAT